MHGLGAVDGAVVGLQVHGELPVLQSLDQVQLPQRPRPVQQGAVQPRYQGEQFPVAARRRQRRVADVVVHVQLLVPLPVHGAELAQRPHFQPVAEGVPQVAVVAENLAQFRQKLHIVNALGQIE